MKTWIVRIASLYVFNVAVLFLIGAILPKVHVGWSALWGAAILTAATIWVKPFVAGLLKNAAARTSTEFRRGKEKLIEYAAVFIVAFVVWVLVLMLSRVNASGFFLGFLLPPLLLLVAWFVYDMIDDRIEKVASDVYDRAETALGRDKPSATTSSAQTSTPADPRATREGRDELKDGLTADQRKMMDEL